MLSISKSRLPMMPFRRNLSSAPSKPHVLVVGGSYGGLSTLQNLLSILAGHGSLPSPVPMPDVKTLPTTPPTITLLDERDGFFHTMGAPLAHSSKNYAPNAWRRYSEMPELAAAGVRILRGTATSIDFSNKTLVYQDASAASPEDTKKQESYDYLVAATGLKRVWPAVPKKHDKVGYLMDAQDHIEALVNADGAIAIVGGGAIGIEVAAELKHLYPEKHIVLVHSRDELLSSEPLPSKFRQYVMEALKMTGVEVLLGRRVMGSESEGPIAESLKLSNGETLRASKVIYCTAKPAPNTDFLDSQALDDSGYVKVSPSLNFAPGIPHNCCHFCAGDIAAWPGIKRVGGALIMGRAVAVNIVGKLVEKEREMMGDNGDSPDPVVKLPPFPDMMALAVGDEGVALGPDGKVVRGQSVKERSFGSDLGLSRIWLGLNMRPALEGTL